MMTLFSSSCTQTHLPTMSSHLHIIKYEYLCKMFQMKWKVQKQKSPCKQNLFLLCRAIFIFRQSQLFSSISCKICFEQFVGDFRRKYSVLRAQFLIKNFGIGSVFLFCLCSCTIQQLYTNINPQMNRTKSILMIRFDFVPP